MFVVFESYKQLAMTSSSSQGGNSSSGPCDLANFDAACGNTTFIPLAASYAMLPIARAKAHTAYVSTPDVRLASARAIGEASPIRLPSIGLAVSNRSSALRGKDVELSAYRADRVAWGCRGGSRPLGTGSYRTPRLPRR